ncbi:anthocyanidin 3-O-glucosyltransferase 7-like [Senna tora]|uniref:Glycosyltransferase n=1 Tax=Senna tora TaxID=362788 RepID=A0A834VZV2_9FABA|nr:anthocyanidin 3-O-glucosyltransferase 7-like [Senna tora]
MAPQSSPLRNPHVAVFAFPYGTHAAPLLNLTIKLARAAPHVSFSFFTTDKSKHSLFSSSSSNHNNIPPNILPYVVSDGIPDAHHFPSPHPLERVNLFLRAGPRNLKEALRQAVSRANERVTCVISDAFVTSALVVAQELGVPWVALWTSYSFSLSAHLNTDLIRQKYSCANDDDDDGGNGSLGFVVPGFSKMRIQDLPDGIIQEEGGEETVFSRMLDSLGRVLPQAKAVIVNFYEELEPPSLIHHLRSKIPSLIYSGFLNLSLPILPSPPSSHTHDKTGSLSFLTKHAPNSVAYISLGTVVAPPPHELAAMAEALEQSKVPFLWSLREDLRAFLPKGFIERTSNNGKGKIVNWAPQTLVLGHGCVGVFVTHGGCNSVSEGVSCGVPMICRPYFGDQFMASRMLEAVWEVGVKIEVFTKEALMKNLNVILVQKEGKVMREKARALKNIVLDAAGPKGKVEKEYFKSLVQLVS